MSEASQLAGEIQRRQSQYTSCFYCYHTGCL